MVIKLIENDFLKVQRKALGSFLSKKKKKTTNNFKIETCVECVECGLLPALNLKYYIVEFSHRESGTAFEKAAGIQ